ncbi:hypothetical protein GCM10023321_58510 [Pseudonocardia eucalypti]|uniref:Uncharacterized protein n=1 Tax=Pseudonocardia eucalypti TaxID=648755 RepID=A0ABP9QTI7_9PSEU
MSANRNATAFPSRSVRDPPTHHLNCEYDSPNSHPIVGRAVPEAAPAHDRHRCGSSPSPYLFLPYEVSLSLLLNRSHHDQQRARTHLARRTARAWATHRSPKPLDASTHPVRVTAAQPGGA